MRIGRIVRIHEIEEPLAPETSPPTEEPVEEPAGPMEHPGPEPEGIDEPEPART